MSDRTRDVLDAANRIPPAGSPSWWRRPSTRWCDDDRPTPSTSTTSSAAAGSSPASASRAPSSPAATRSTRWAASARRRRGDEPRRSSRRTKRHTVVFVELARRQRRHRHRHPVHRSRTTAGCGPTLGVDEPASTSTAPSGCTRASRSWPSATAPGRSRSSRASATPTTTSRTSRRSRTGGRAARARRARRAGSAATSTRRSGSTDPLAGVVIGPGPSPALLGERSFATSISDASGSQPGAPAWITIPTRSPTRGPTSRPARSTARRCVGQVQAAVGLTGDARADLAGTLSAAPATGDDDASTAAAYGNGSAGRRVSTSPRRSGRREGAAQGHLRHQPRRLRHAPGPGRAAPGAATRISTPGSTRFFTSVDGAGVADNVIVVTVSEFGRRAQENGSGTDHGAASAHFIIGSKVKGGRYGEPTVARAARPHAATCRWRSTSVRCTRPRSRAGSASTPNPFSVPDSSRQAVFA